MKYMYVMYIMSYTLISAAPYLMGVRACVRARPCLYHYHKKNNQQRPIKWPVTEWTNGCSFFQPNQWSSLRWRRSLTCLQVAPKASSGSISGNIPAAPILKQTESIWVVTDLLKAHAELSTTRKAKCNVFQPDRNKWTKLSRVRRLLFLFKVNNKIQSLS